ncbi:MAG: sulfurtransferase FdhD [Acidiferrobacteraceae bacterium]|nr:sulfurtransferase FdhD [Acidiferrobacteraceae bacterium]
MNNTADNYSPTLSNAGQAPSVTVSVQNSSNNTCSAEIAAERPLTIYINKQETVTLLTLGTHPELLALGYLWNQGLFDNLHNIRSVCVDWNKGSASIQTSEPLTDNNSVINHQAGPARVSTGANPVISRTEISTLLERISDCNQLYRRIGGVHGCAIFHGAKLVYFVEDIGRHNATDIVAGYMWLNGIYGGDKKFYATGRLTSEIVLKLSRMGIPTAISRSSITHLGLELAQELGITLIGRAKGRQFVVYNGSITIPDATKDGN